MPTTPTTTLLRLANCTAVAFQLSSCGPIAKEEERDLSTGPYPMPAFLSTSPAVGRARKTPVPSFKTVAAFAEAART